MGKVWPIGPNDEPVGWFSLPGNTEYQEAEYREDEPKPVAPVTVNWKAWKRARNLSWTWLLGSMAYYVTHIAWGTFWFFFASCWFWSIIFWCVLELKHQETLRRMDEAAMRTQIYSRK